MKHYQYDFLDKGYRNNSIDCCSSTKSICNIHNETFNIWSHLLGFFACLWLIYYEIYYDFCNDKIPKIIYLFAASFCMLCSSVYHIYLNMNYKYYRLFFIFDVVGINILISVTSISITLRNSIYNLCFTLILTLSFSVLTILILYNKFIIRNENKVIQYYILSLILTWIPILEYSYYEEYGIDILFGFIISNTIYYLGFIIWLLKYPEKIFFNKNKKNILKKLSYFGNSHNIIHICVMVAMFINYYNFGIFLNCNN